MKSVKFAVVLITLTAIGCATIADHRRLKKFEETSRAYGNSIRWADYDTARVFLKESGTVTTSADVERLQRIRVTGYQVKQYLTSADKKEVIQIVQINYFRVDNPVLRTVEDRQTWQYDRAAANWYLISGLPDFR